MRPVLYHSASIETEWQTQCILISDTISLQTIAVYNFSIFHQSCWRVIKLLFSGDKTFSAVARLRIRHTKSRSWRFAKPNSGCRLVKGSDRWRLYTIFLKLNYQKEFH